VRLEFMMLANHAEVQGGLLYISGGTFDTINVQARMEGGPPGSVAALQGTLVIRMLFDFTETDKDHAFDLSLVDEDGQEIVRSEVPFHVAKTVGLPEGWDQGHNIVANFPALALPKFGEYAFHLTVDGEPVGDRPFRVLKLY
jgi:hypothetical protein